MTAPLRIRSPQRLAPDDPAKNYLDRLIKLIPAEVVGLYLAGKGAIQAAYPKATEAEALASGSGESIAWLGWTVFCFIAVFLIRGWATSDRDSGLGPQWPAVLIAAASFLVWVYSLGDGFAVWGLWHPLFASLLLLAWSFLAPFIYRGDDKGGSAAGRGPNTYSNRGFGPAQAEKCVLDSAERLTNRRFGLSEKVSAGFEGEQQVRIYLGEIQDMMKRDYGINVDLAGGSADYVTKISKMSFMELAIEIEKRAKA